MPLAETTKTTAADHVLVVYNKRSAESTTLKDYYLANRPGFASANVLALDMVASPNITEAGYKTLIETPLLSWISSSKKKIRYVVFMKDVPYDTTDGTSQSVGYRLFRTKNSDDFNTNCKVKNKHYSIEDYPNTPFLPTWVWTGDFNSTKAYIDKLAKAGIVSGLVLGSANRGTKYYLDDAGAAYNPTNQPGKTTWWGMIGKMRDALLAAGVKSTDIVYKSFTDAHITSASDVAAYSSWGANGGLGGNYANDGRVKFTGKSAWYLVCTIESFNGDYSTGQGNFVDWFQANAFGGTSYSNTPIGSVGHTYEPKTTGVNDSDLFSMWVSGWYFAECAWGSSKTPYQLVTGDPLTSALVPTIVPPPVKVPTVSITANPTSVLLGTNSTLTWTSTDAISATLNGSSVTPTGTKVVSPTGTTQYDISVTGPGGTAKSFASVIVKIPPTAKLSVSSSEIILGQKAVLTWTTTNASKVTLNGQTVGANGTMEVAPTTTTSYSLAAIGDGGNAAAFVSVAVKVPPPTASLTLSKNTITLGESSTLTWSTTNATNTTLDGKVVSLSGTTSVSPQQDTTYVLNVSGLGGTATSSANLVVKIPAPTCTFTANKTSITSGETVILNWATTNATTVKINGQPVATTGTQTVVPTVNTTYTLDVTGPGGSTSSVVSVVVTVPGPIVMPESPPSGLVSAFPKSIKAGETSLIRWTTLRAENVTLNGNKVDLNGSLTVSPTVSTSYVLVISNAAGSRTFTTSVAVTA